MRERVGPTLREKLLGPTTGKREFLRMYRVRNLIVEASCIAEAFSLKVLTSPKVCLRVIILDAEVLVVFQAFETYHRGSASNRVSA